MGVIYKNNGKKKLEHVATVKGNNVWKCEIYAVGWKKLYCLMF